MPSDDGDDGGANDGDGAVEQGEGDDFDDFEEGEEVDDFGDFDEGAQLSEDESQPTRQPATPVVTPEFVRETFLGALNTACFIKLLFRLLLVFDYCLLRMSPNLP